MIGKKLPKRRRIRDVIALTFIATFLLSLGLTAVVNRLFLQRYYITDKSKALVEMYDYINTSLTGDGDASNLEEFSRDNNLSWVVQDENGRLYDSDARSEEENKISGQLFGFMTGQEDDEDTTVLVDVDEYKIQISDDHYGKSRYVILLGTFDNGYQCMIRSPLGSIQDNADLSSRFSLYVGLVLTLLSTILIWFFVQHVTKPIQELTSITRDMANLDFQSKYSGHANNEIDELGENFNYMSEKLESTIQELKQANLELEKDIEDKIRIEQRRTEFLHNVSHELKTPIALIQGYAEGLKDNISDDPESREFYCEVIMDEAARMNHMVRQLLSLTQLESGQDVVTLKHFDIVELIHGVVSKSEILAKQKEASVQISGAASCMVWGDDFKIEEVVTNFFTNALNHIDGDRLIEIKVSKEEEKARISVFNTGKPIPEEDLENIWKKFYKVDKAHTREYGGSGIGLSIVKAIMESHHQAYGVKNYKNGVEFWFELSTK